MCLFENELFTAERCCRESFNKYKMDTTGAAMQILQQFESAFSDFLNPNTPQDQRNAIGRGVCVSVTSRPSIHEL